VSLKINIQIEIIKMSQQKQRREEALRQAYRDGCNNMQESIRCLMRDIEKREWNVNTMWDELKREIKEI